MEHKIISCLIVVNMAIASETDIVGFVSKKINESAEQFIKEKGYRKYELLFPLRINPPKEKDIPDGLKKENVWRLEADFKIIP